MMGGQIVYATLVIILPCTMEAMHNKVCPLQAGLEQLDATNIKVMMMYLEPLMTNLSLSQLKTLHIYQRSISHLQAKGFYM